MFWVITISSVSAGLLAMLPAIARSIACVTGSQAQCDAVLDAPRREEAAFRLAPFLFLAFPFLLTLAAATAGLHFQGAVLWDSMNRFLPPVLFGAFAGGFASMSLDELFIGTQWHMRERDSSDDLGIWPRYNMVSVRVKYCDGTIDSFGELISLLWFGVFFYFFGRGFLILAGVVVVQVSVLTSLPECSPADGIVSASFASLATIAVAAPTLLVLTANEFATRHSYSEDAVANALIDSDAYYDTMFRKGLAWGSPYAAVMFAAAVGLGTMLIFRVWNPLLFWLLGLGVPLGLAISFVVTSRLHLQANKGALAIRNSVPPSMMLAHYLDWWTQGHGERITNLLDSLATVARDHPALSIPSSQDEIALALLRLFRTKVRNQSAQQKRLQQIQRAASNAISATHMRRTLEEVPELRELFLGFQRSGVRGASLSDQIATIMSESTRSEQFWRNLPKEHIDPKIALIKRLMDALSEETMACNQLAQLLK